MKMKAIKSSACMHLQIDFTSYRATYIATMRLVFPYTVIICLLLGSIDAQICQRNFSIGTEMQCTRCTGKLQMDFRPYRRVSYLQRDQTEELNCTVNKPANITFFLHHTWKPVTEEARELSTTTNIFFIKLRKLNGGCTYRIKLPASSSSISICSIGTYTCKAVTHSNETIIRTQKVDGDYALGGPPFTFKAEDPDLQRTRQLIIGTSANLSCSFNSPSWQIWKPQILIWKLSADGVATRVRDSNDKPKRFESQGYFDEIKHSKYTTFIRRLFLRHIGADANTTFFCRVSPFRDQKSCLIEKRLELRTRPCKAGYYCDPNSSKELPCLPGTYSNITGLFDKSGCRTCPLDAYCPSGSPLPIPCPSSQFLPARDTTLKIYEGKRNQNECRLCPVDPCDAVAEHCTFICGNTRFEGILGQKFSVRCLLSDGTLMRNLTWYKGKKEIVDSVPYRIDHREKELVLTIDKLSLEDSGIYVCSGYDRIMGNQFNSTVRLDVTDSEKSLLLDATDSEETSKKPLAVLLSVCFAAIFAVMTGILYRYWRHKRSQSDEYIDLLDVSKSLIYEKYDVFICYSSADKTWVRRTLLPTLKDVNLRVCIDFEDFNAGSFIIENVADAISSSRTTLAVLSPDFLCSEWCQKELMMALTRVRDTHRVIPVMYRSCEVPLFLRDVTYLDWCNEEVRETFWEQLVRTIRDTMKLEMDSEACNTNESEVKSTAEHG